MLDLFDGVDSASLKDARAAELAALPVGERLERRIIDGEGKGLEEDLDLARANGVSPLEIINDHLLAGMKIVGERFGSGEMQLPFVLQSAAVMKSAVALLEPHMEKTDEAGKGTIVLCRTSNSGSGEFQSKLVNGSSLYKHVATAAASKWRDIGDTALVMGATYPQELAEVRGIVDDMPILVPGIGAQGGDIVSAVRAGRNEVGTGLIINSSRAVLYASNGEDFAQASRAVAIDTRDAIRAANN